MKTSPKPVKDKKDISDSGDDPTPLSTAEATVIYARSGFDLDLHPATIIRRVHQRATACFQQILADDNLSPTQFAALATILKHGAVSQNHLGRLTSMDPSTISIVVRKLLKVGLIERTVSQTDLRLSIIVLTETGTRYTLERLKRSKEVGEVLLAALNPQEQATLLTLLQKLYDDNGSNTTKA